MVSDHRNPKISHIVVFALPIGRGGRLKRTGVAYPSANETGMHWERQVAMSISISDYCANILNVHNAGGIYHY